MVKINKFDIKAHGEIKSWDEALPLGDGITGCLVYGKSPLKLAFDRIDLWDERENPITKESGFNYKNLVALATSGKEGDWTEFTRLFDDVYTSKPYPTKITAGRAEISFKRDIADVYSFVDIKKAVAAVDEKDGKKLASFFVHQKTDLFVGKIYEDFSLKLVAPKYLSDATNGLGYPCGQFLWRDGECYLQETPCGFVYGIFTYQNKVSDGTELFVAVRKATDRQKLIDNALKELKCAAEIGHDELLKQHVSVWRAYWNKSQISTDNDIIDQTYYRATYLLASCSKKGGYPMPLQGVWTADDGKIPPWKGDYHFDTNVELSYQSYLKSNRLDQGTVLIDYLWDNRGVYKKFAKKFYGVDGLIIPACSTLDGKPMGGWGQYAFSPTMTIWAAQSFDEYYLYSGDEKFLKKRAYPFFKEIESAIKGLLVERNGKLYLPLSSSPEIFDNTRRAYLTPNSNFDLALLIYLYKTLIGYACKLGLDDSEYVTTLSKLDELAIGENGVIMLDRNTLLPETHRHFSHLMCLYPLHLINYDTDEHKRIYNATIRQLEYLGTGMWVGFSFAMSAQIYAMAKNGNAAYQKLFDFCNGFVGNNGFHLNGDYKHLGYTTFHYRPFTLESLFGFCDALHEMLLQDHEGSIELFPAIPQSWQNGKVSFKNLRSRGGLLVSAQFSMGKITATIKSPNAQTIKICGKNVALNKGGNIVLL